MFKIGSFSDSYNSTDLKRGLSVTGNVVINVQFAAGHSVGDEIVGIDGKPASQFTSSQIEKLLKQNGVEYSPHPASRRQDASSKN